MGDCVHAEGELLAWVLQQLAPLGEGLGNHLALLDPFGLIITLPSQPESRKGRVQKWRNSDFPSNLMKKPGMQPPTLEGLAKAVSQGLRSRGLPHKESSLELRLLCALLSNHLLSEDATSWYKI
jgi:hypothetical protein